MHSLRAEEFVCMCAWRVDPFTNQNARSSSSVAEPQNSLIHSWQLITVWQPAHDTRYSPHHEQYRRLTPIRSRYSVSILICHRLTALRGPEQNNVSECFAHSEIKCREKCASRTRTRHVWIERCAETHRPTARLKRAALWFKQPIHKVK